MAELTAANSKKIIPSRRIDGHSARVTDGPRSDSAQNVLYIDHLHAADTGQTTVEQHERRCFFSFTKPTASDYAAANIGDKFCVFLSDTSETTNPYDYEEWFKVNGGWAKSDMPTVADVTITSAELLALHTTEKTLVDAPGAGKIVVPEGPVMFQLGSGTTAYADIAAGDDMVLSYGAATSGTALFGTLETTGYLDQTTKKTAVANGDASFMAEPNTAITAKLLGAITTGDSDLKVRVKYRTYDDDAW